MPGKEELMAVSSVQSMKAPFGSRSLWVGRIRAATAGVMLGRSRAVSEVSPPALIGGAGIAGNAGGAEPPMSALAPGVETSMSVAPVVPPAAGASLELDTGWALDARETDTGPPNRRSKASSADDFVGACAVE
jgi:hypothetical protein